MAEENKYSLEEGWIIEKNRRVKKKPIAYIVIGVSMVVGYYLFGFIGQILALVIGCILSMVIISMLSVRMGNNCIKDFLYLKSKLYSDVDALVVISKSFNNKLSDAFYKEVINKFTTIDEVIYFYGILMPENISDDEDGFELLKNAKITKKSSGVYDVRKQ